MRIIKLGSIIGFFGGLLVFLGSNFFCCFKFNEQIIFESIKNEHKSNLLMQLNKNLFLQSCTNQFSFNKAIDIAFIKSNAALLKMDGLNKRDKENIIYISTLENKIDFNIAAIETFFAERNRYSENKITQLKKHAQLISAKSYKTIVELDKDLEVEINKINSEILLEKGFSKEEIKKLKFVITKRSVQGKWLSQRKILASFALGISFLALCLFLFIDKKLITEENKLEGSSKVDYFLKRILIVLVSIFSILILIVAFYWPEYITNLL